MKDAHFKKYLDELVKNRPSDFKKGCTLTFCGKEYNITEDEFYHFCDEYYLYPKSVSDSGTKNNILPIDISWSKLLGVN